MKINWSMLILISCMIVSFFSCSTTFDKILIPANKIEEVKSSMKFVQEILYKSKFDTLSIKQSMIQNKVETELLYNKNLKKDSLLMEINKNFTIDNYFPFHKKFIYGHNWFYYIK